MKHILVGDAGEDTTWVLKAAKTGKPLVGWIVPKGAHVGDQVLFYLPAHGLSARGVIATKPRQRAQRQGTKVRYDATVRKISLLSPAAPLAFLCENHRSWKWPTYARSYVTIDGRTEERLEELLKSELLKSYSTPPLGEGGSKSVLLTVYERNREARRICLDQYGKACYGCGVSFGKTYGEIAEEYIQVQHLKPVSAVGGEYVVDPIKDLRPICPNCHAVVHLQTPPLSILKLKRMLKRAARSSHR
jgi:hypothetical protein